MSLNCKKNPTNPNCIGLPKKNLYGYIVISVVIGSLVTGLGVYYGTSESIYDNGYTDGDQSHYTTTGYITPTIDGNIEYDEWKLADYGFANPITQYLDLNNSLDPTTLTRNIDTFNYIYVGQDSENFYVAVDLCGDRTNNEEDEWLALFLNTLDREFESFNTSADQFNDFRNNGTECFVYNIENDTLIEGVSDSNGIKEGYPLYIEEDDKTLYQGIHNTDETNSWVNVENQDSSFYVINSTNDFGNDAVQIDVTIDLVEYLNIEEFYFDQIRNDMGNMTISIALKIVDTTYGSPYDESDLDICRLNVNFNETNSGNLDIGSDFILNTFDVSPSAYNDGNLDFSLIIEDDDLDQNYFVVRLDYLRIDYKASDQFDEVYGTTTVQDYEIAWNYTTSPKCDERHRTFEISIPKYELEGFSETGDLEIYVQGYGTASMPSYSTYLSMNPCYWFSPNYEYIYETKFGEDTELSGPYDPHWSQNYFVITMGLERDILI